MDVANEPSQQSDGKANTVEHNNNMERAEADINGPLRARVELTPQNIQLPEHNRCTKNLQQKEYMIDRSRDTEKLQNGIESKKAPQHPKQTQHPRINLRLHEPEHGHEQQDREQHPNSWRRR